MIQKQSPVPLFVHRRQIAQDQQRAVPDPKRWPLFAMIQAAESEALAFLNEVRIQTTSPSEPEPNVSDVEFEKLFDMDAGEENV